MAEFSKLYILEKPSVGRAIAEYLGKKKGIKHTSYTTDKTGRATSLKLGDICITWVFGHILELAELHHYNSAIEKWDDSIGLLPYVPEKWQLLPIASSKAQFNLIGSLIDKSDVIIHGGDPDREGQLLVDEVLEKHGNRKPVKRILPNGIDDQSLDRILSSETDNSLNLGLYHAGKARQRADFIVGINLTRIYTHVNQKNGFRGTISLGRVQTPTLAIIVKRDLEIENFQSSPYFELTADIKVEKGKFNARWVQPKNIGGCDSQGRLIDMNVAGRVKQECEGARSQITDYKIEGKETQPPLPHSLQTLQKKASRLYKMPAKKVLDVCQSLYEKKICTYPRSDSCHILDEQWGQSRDVLKAIGSFNPEFSKLVSGANTELKSAAFNSAKAAPHHAIIPTSSGSYASMTPDEIKLFQLICLQYIAQFYPAYQYRQTSIVAKIGSHEFKASGRTPVNQGWKVVFGADADGDSKDKDKDGEADVNQLLPITSQGEVGECPRVFVVKKMTKPPLPYTEGTLLDAMSNVHELVSDPEVKKRLREMKGIGTSATQASIIETLKDRKFASDKLLPGYLVSTPAGKLLIKFAHKDLKDVTLTALWENALVRIEKGQMTLDKFIDGQTQWIKILAKFGFESNVAIPVGLLTDVSAQAATENAGKPCPQCSVGKLRLMEAKKGENKGKIFLSCSAYPDCKYSEDIEGQDLPKKTSRGSGSRGGKRGSK